MKEILLATSNTGKINELKSMLAPIVCIPQHQLGIDDAKENGLSFIENALIKARHASEASGKPALADDSGLVIPALHGEPGIYSARYAGNCANASDHIALVLKNMAHVPAAEREAFFYCAMALVRHAKDPIPVIATGLFKGSITTAPIGDGGFGYDPIFYVAEYQCTMAQLPAAIKNTLSHRANALQQLRLQLSS